MKKTSFIILIPFIFLISCNDVTVEMENDIESNGLHGMVKEVNYKTFKNDSLIEEIIVHYSNTGYITLREEFKNSSVIVRESIDRDSKNRIISIITSHQNGTVQKRTYQYEKNGLKKIVQKVNGTENTEWDYKNDNLGRKIHEVINIEGDFVRNIEYEYIGDSITKTVFFNEDGSKQSIITTKEKDNIVETIFENYTSKNITANGRIEIRLDSLNNPIKEAHFTNGVFSKSFSYWYDFDENRNWIVQFKYKDEEIIEVVEREIKYY
jgi:hypothetical protein